MTDIPTLSEHELALRIGLAMLCGGLVGIEREWRDRAAGLRTHMLVTLGSTLFTLLSLYGATEWIEFSAQAAGTRPLYTSDPGRIAAQIVSGIGFIGAGAIWRSRTSVHGVTTAASLWIMAAIGMAVGVGWYWTAIFSTASILGVLLVVRFVSHHVREQGAESIPHDLIVYVRVAESHVVEAVTRCMSEIGYPPVQISLSRKERDGDRRLSRTVTMTLEHAEPQAAGKVLSAVSALDGVLSMDVETR
jgi:putative Mg2+ transporter-C (MgtC) family protein